jgi:hypothetical protein
MTEVAQGILSKYIEKGFGSCCRTETGLLERPYNGSLLKHAETKQIWRRILRCRLRRLVIVVCCDMNKEKRRKRRIRSGFRIYCNTLSTLPHLFMIYTLLEIILFKSGLLYSCAYNTSLLCSYCKVWITAENGRSVIMRRPPQFQNGKLKY